MTTEFDERARTWDDDPQKWERAGAIAEQIAAEAAPGPATRLLEYGAGTGLVAQALADRVGQVTLADPSAGMREVMREKVAAGVLPTDARVWDLDLARDPLPSDRFDLVASVMALHHIRDYRAVLGAFASLLAPGGYVAVVDLDEDDGSFHAHSPEFAGHDGFPREQFRRDLESAGFDDVTVRTCYELERDDGVYALFLATGRRVEA